MGMRFEYYDNLVSKHRLSKIDWRQAATWAFNNNLNAANHSVAGVRMTDADTVEIIKRKDQNKSLLYK